MKINQLIDFSKQVSHRWNDKDAPDQDGTQFRALQTFLREDEAGKRIRYVFFVRCPSLDPAALGTSPS